MEHNTVYTRFGISKRSWSCKYRAPKAVEKIRMFRNGTFVPMTRSGVQHLAAAPHSVSGWSLLFTSYIAFCCFWAQTRRTRARMVFIFLACSAVGLAVSATFINIYLLRKILKDAARTLAYKYNVFVQWFRSFPRLRSTECHDRRCFAAMWDGSWKMAFVWTHRLPAIGYIHDKHITINWSDRRRASMEKNLNDKFLDQEW